ncbi:MAG TPA: M23 family metallopeptidase [Gemmatimonadales bacterium]|nr:M23 family metallopeptidase [Gemmatimonadales bacterium]
MSERKWTLVVVPPGSGASRAIEVSQRVLKAVTGFAGVLGLVALFLGYGTVSHTLNLHRAAQLERENAELAEQLGQLHGQIANLSDTIKKISLQDTRIRLLADLEPNDPSVQQAGIGGPSTPDSTSLSLLTMGMLGHQTEEIRVDLGALIRRANLLAASFGEARDSLLHHRERLTAMPSIMPTVGWLSSAFSSMREHPILHIMRPHEGIDVTAPLGAPIKAPAAGRVISAGWETGYGNTIEIDHGFGIQTKYAHCSKLVAKVGQRVERGQIIAEVGSTGLATGPHLHYEVHVNGKPVDPLRYVLPDVVVD